MANNLNLPMSSADFRFIAKRGDTVLMLTGDVFSSDSLVMDEALHLIEGALTGAGFVIAYTGDEWPYLEGK